MIFASATPNCLNSIPIQLAKIKMLPAQLGKYFANNSLIVLYPDQLGEPQDMLSFSNPRGNNEDQHYEKVGKWFYKWFKKSN